MEKQVVIATFLYQIYYSQSNGFCVCNYKEKRGKSIKCIGTDLPSYKDIEYELSGEWEKDKNGNEQFKVESFTEHVEKKKDSIIAFLSSGAIRGIGKKTAERIFEMYGTDSLEVIEKHPENLLRVRGISKDKLDMIIDSYAENHLPKDIIEMLLPCGFSTKQVIKVYKKYRADYLLKIKENPYELCQIKGITFSLCDRVGRLNMIGECDHRRLQCAIIEALKENFFEGKVGATLSDIVKKSSKLTSLMDGTLIRDEVIFMAKAGLISYRKIQMDGRVITYFYQKNVQVAEEKLANLIIQNIGLNDKSQQAEKYLNTASEIRFDDTQRKAIINAFKYRLSIITGGPGTGKTTISKKIAEINKKIYGKYPVMLAPTGKAARRISESTGIEAYTIHSYLNLRPIEDEDHMYEDVEPVMIKNECVMIDEFSMVDMMLSKTLFEHLINCRVIIIGDPDQLQSVGAGNVLLDMINSEKIPTSKLIYEHRQGEGSTIKKNANGMQDGQKSFSSANDFICEYVKDEDRKNVLTVIEDKMVAEYLRYFNDPAYNSVVCLCPYKNFATGMYSVNKKLQDMINPRGNGAEFNGTHEMVFRVGDPIMHVEKNTDEVSNGNTGIVKSIRKIDNELTLIAEYDLGNKVVTVKYTTQNISQLTLAYAITVHKSQGSEYDAIVTCLSKFHKMMLKRRIPYTAITRSKKSVSIFLDAEETLVRAIDNDCTEDRNTLLCYLIRQAGEKSVIFDKKIIRKGDMEGQLKLAL